MIYDLDGGSEKEEERKREKYLQSGIHERSAWEGCLFSFLFLFLFPA